MKTNKQKRVFCKDCIYLNEKRFYKKGYTIAETDAECNRHISGISYSFLNGKRYKYKHCEDINSDMYCKDYVKDTIFSRMKIFFRAIFHK